MRVGMGSLGKSFVQDIYNSKVLHLNPAPIDLGFYGLVV
jgi:hypothetical protein